MRVCKVGWCCACRACWIDREMRGCCSIVRFRRPFVRPLEHANDTESIKNLEAASILAMLLQLGLFSIKQHQLILKPKYIFSWFYRFLFFSFFFFAREEYGEQESKDSPNVKRASQWLKSLKENEMFEYHTRTLWHRLHYWHFRQRDI